MGLLIDYFVAPDDATAARAVDDLPAELPTTDGSGIDPNVVLAQFEELLTGRTYEEILDDPQAYQVVRATDDGEVFVVRLSPEFVQVLVAAPDETLRELADPWSRIEEFWGQGEPAALIDFLTRLKLLAQQPGAVYCRVSL